MYTYITIPVHISSRRELRTSSIVHKASYPMYISHVFAIRCASSGRKLSCTKRDTKQRVIFVRYRSRFYATCKPFVIQLTKKPRIYRETKKKSMTVREVYSNARVYVQQELGTIRPGQLRADQTV
jgi:hypothetical protein